MNKISRKISFYRAFFRNGEEEVSVTEVFSHINGLSDDIDGRYLPMKEGNSRCVNLESTDIPLKGIYGTKRESGLPLMDVSGDRAPLEMPEGGGLYEPMHFVIFPENVVGCEYNSHAPRIESLKTYLPKKASEILDNVELFPLMKKDVAREISRMGRIRLFDLSIHKDMSEHLRILDDNLIDKLNTALEDNRYTDVLEIILKPKDTRRGWINLGFLNRIPQFLAAAKDDIDTAKIHAENVDNDNKMKTFDLLNLFISTTRSIELIDEMHKVVNSGSAFDEIIDAYHELKPEIDDIISE